MGLLKSGVKYGGIFLAAREGIKYIEQRGGKKAAQQHAQQQQLQYGPNGYSRQHSPVDPYTPQQPQYPEQSRDIYAPQQQPELDYGQQPREAGFHQVWCNGRCGGKCGAKEALMAINSANSSRAGSQEKLSDAKPPPAY